MLLRLVQLCYCAEIQRMLYVKTQKTRSSAVAERPRDVHVIAKFSYVVTEYV